jgi:putative oxidoreductase
MTYRDTGSEPTLIVPGLRPFYENISILSWPLIRITAGAILFTHGWPKLMTVGVQAFAANSLAKRGIEPSLLFAYIVIFLETAGAILLMLGLFTRPIALLLVIEFVVIIIWAQYPNGYAWNRPGGGWEYPLFWGLINLAVFMRGGGPYSLDRKLGREF